MATRDDAALRRAMGWIELLAGEIGPRRPTSEAEERAARAMATELGAHGVEAELEPFDGYSTFAAPLGAIGALTLLPLALPRALRATRTLVGALAAGALVTEANYRWTPLSNLLSTRRSLNLVATIEPTGVPRRTLCLICHLDTSRSGFMFHPAVSRHLPAWFKAQAAATLIGAWEPVLGGSRTGRGLLAAARAFSVGGLVSLLVRELRGEDVPGANDNASGSAVAAALAAECGAKPPASTRVVLLMTGCEESGLLGAQAFLRAHETRDWLFLNFDTVGGDARAPRPTPLRYVVRDGVGRTWAADPGLLGVFDRLAAEHPELRLCRAPLPIGLTYDTTPVAARGGRSLTVVAGEKTLPNYHATSDVVENVSRETVARALAAGRAAIAAIDAGEVDPERPSIP